MTELSPLDIVESLTIEDIDAAIVQMQDNLNALRALRRVAEARVGKSGAGQSARTTRPDDSELRARMVELLLKRGPMQAIQLYKLAGIHHKTGTRLLHDEMFTKDAPTIGSNTMIYLTSEAGRN